MDYLAVDAALRAEFAEADGTCGDGERQLKCDVVLRPPALLAPFGLLVSDEWEPIPGWSQGGRGDLVFTDGRGRYAVVEVKWMARLYAGPSQRKRRNRKRGKVKEQARAYAEYVLGTRADAIEVRMMTYTNDPQGGGLRDLGGISRPGAAAGT